MRTEKVVEPGEGTMMSSLMSMNRLFSLSFHRSTRCSTDNLHMNDEKSSGPLHQTCAVKSEGGHLVAIELINIS